MEQEVYTHMLTIDQTGRITLPKQVLKALGVEASHTVEVLIELTEAGIIIRPKRTLIPITERIAAMDLPVAAWEGMEQEIEAGRLD
ncbi:MAG: AbrB/MazE/SpoVT family DNA-binding domain-containing protein [Anaerolineae bacterium]